MSAIDEYGFKKSDENFKRPKISEEIKYRKIKRLTFERELKSVLPNDCTLCFHGTSIWNTQKILKSKNISAEIDRVGAGENVLDMKGKIYVTTLDKVWFTIRHFADLGNYSYPAGCIFVLTPKDDVEIKSSREENVIGNVYFNREPDRLKAIITTPENITRVKTWVAESGLNVSPKIVVDYDEFINLVKDFNASQVHNIYLPNFKS